MPPGAISPNFRPRSLSDAVRLLQVATPARSRNPGSAASAQCPKAARATSIAFALGRPCSVHLALSSLSSHTWRHYDRQARDCCALASNGFCRLLAMEIPSARGPTADRQRGARSHPKNEFWEPAVGRSQDPWRVAHPPPCLVTQAIHNGLSQRPSSSSQSDVVPTMVGPPKADHSWIIEKLIRESWGFCEVAWRERARCTVVSATS